MAFRWVERLYLLNQEDPETAWLRLNGFDDDADRLDTERALTDAMRGAA